MFAQCLDERSRAPGTEQRVSPWNQPTGISLPGETWYPGHGHRSLVANVLLSARPFFAVAAILVRVGSPRIGISRSPLADILAAMNLAGPQRGRNHVLAPSPVHHECESHQRVRLPRQSAGLPEPEFAHLPERVSKC